jgi:hypothetical protein
VRIAVALGAAAAALLIIDGAARVAAPPATPAGIKVFLTEHSALYGMMATAIHRRSEKTG